LDLANVKETHDSTLEVASDFKIKNDEILLVHARLVEDYEQLRKEHQALQSELTKITEPNA
jgi:hypothetical protein